MPAQEPSRPVNTPAAARELQQHLAGAGPAHPGDVPGARTLDGSSSVLNGGAHSAQAGSAAAQAIAQAIAGPAGAAAVRNGAKGR